MNGSHLMVLGLAALFLMTATTEQALAQDKPAKAQKQRAKSGGLAGSVGDVKRKVSFPPMTEGGCQSHYRRYIAAGGHSAYAATAIDYFYGGAFACGLSLNASSQAEAERRAVADCKLAIRQSLARTKSLTFTGPCMIHTSK